MNSKLIIVFDTNVLLDLYSYSKETITNVIDELKKDEILNSIYLPKQVYDEFKENYQRVRNDSRKYFQNKKVNFINAKIKIEKNLDQMFTYADDRCQNEIHRYINEIKNTFHIKTNLINDEFDKIIEESNISFNSDDEDLILDWVEIIRKRCPSKGFSLIEKLHLSIEGEQRFKLKLSPGYKDADKNKDDSFKKYGDFFIWKEILRKYNESPSCKVLLVENELKNDWWEYINDERVPSKILMEECSDLLMINFYNFLINYCPKLNQNSINEIGELSNALSRIMKKYDSKLFLTDELNNEIRDVIYNEIEEINNDEEKIEVNINSFESKISFFKVDSINYEYATNLVKCEIYIELDFKYEADLITIDENNSPIYDFTNGDCKRGIEFKVKYKLDKINFKNPLKFICAENIRIYTNYSGLFRDYMKKK